MSSAAKRWAMFPQRPGDFWSGGAVALPMFVGQNGKPQQASAIIWGDSTGFVISFDIFLGTGGGFAAIAAELDKATGQVQHRPEIVRVWDPALAEFLQGTLAGTDTQVQMTDRPDWIDEFLGGLASHLAKEDHGSNVPHLVHGSVTLDMARDFAEAAADFFRAEPWRRFDSDDDLIEIETPTAPPGMKCCSVLGAAGEEYGVGFYATPAQFRKVQTIADPLRMLEKLRLWSIMLGSGAEFAPEEIALWEREKWPRADPNNYPLALGYGPGTKVSRPDADQLRFMVIVLRALAQSTETEIDLGQWEKSVTAFGLPVVCRLKLPDLLAAKKQSAAASKKGRKSKSGPISQDDWVLPDAAPNVRAMDLIDRAHDQTGRRRVQLLKQALEIWPDCAEAYNMQAMDTGDPKLAEELYLKALAAGERAIGPNGFKQFAGHFWGFHETRPYMRARIGLAEVLFRTGRKEQAIEHAREMLRLNPGDNQGIRYILAAWLLETRKHDEVTGLFKRYDDDASAWWAYSRALLAYRLGGDSESSRIQRSQAARQNPYVFATLEVSREGELDPPPHYSIGDITEAICYVASDGHLWLAEPGATAWLAQEPVLKPAAKSKPRRKK